MIKRNPIQEFWFACRAFWELTKSCYTFDFEEKCITAFGSARFKEGDQYYELAYEIGKQIALNGYIAMTGGGPGLMEAVNKGAYENGGKSMGCNIWLPHEQKPNPYMHKSLTLKFFFTRKVSLVKYSQAFIILPGGVGTMDEFFEVYTLMQTGYMNSYPIVLIGKEFHKELIENIDEMIRQKTMSCKDKLLLYVTDSPEDALCYINQKLKERGVGK
ncbi:MAG: TIGR00730 family Rossman fold protein [Chitinophagaceae bacterium]